MIIESDPTDRGLSTPVKPLPRPGPNTQLNWSASAVKAAVMALYALWNSTVSRQRSEADISTTATAYLEGVKHVSPDAVMLAIAAWPRTSEGKWWPTLHELIGAAELEQRKQTSGQDGMTTRDGHCFNGVTRRELENDFRAERGGAVPNWTMRAKYYRGKAAAGVVDDVLEITAPAK